MQLEKDKLKADVKLATAKADSIAAAQRQEELAAEAIRAMKMYTGQMDSYEDEFDD